MHPEEFFRVLLSENKKKPGQNRQNRNNADDQSQLTNSFFKAADLLGWRLHCLTAAKHRRFNVLLFNTGDAFGNFFHGLGAQVRIIRQHTLQQQSEFRGQGQCVDFSLKIGQIMFSGEQLYENFPQRPDIAAKIQGTPVNDVRVTGQQFLKRGSGTIQFGI